MRRQVTRITEKDLTARFKDREGMLQDRRRAAEFARLRREMWARFRESIEAEEPNENGAGRPAGGEDGTTRQR